MTDEHGLSANLDDLHKAKATQGRVRPLESFMEPLIWAQKGKEIQRRQ